MLAASNRLRDTKDIARVKRNGKEFHSEKYTLLFLYRKDKNPSRFAFIVSTAVHKNASIRNKVKRGMREAIRQSLFSIKPGYDCLIIAKPESSRQYTSDIMSEVRALVDRTALVTPRPTLKK